MRYIDDLVLRDRDTTGNGTLDERLYALQDANWNVTSISNTTGAIQERYAYSAYGVPMFLDASFNSKASSSYDWETLFAGYRWDSVIQICHVRNRILLVHLATWGQRDPLGLSAGMNLYEYVSSNPVIYVDPSGTVIPPPLVGCLVGFGWGLAGGLLVNYFTNPDSPYSSAFCAGVGGCVGGAIIAIAPSFLTGCLAGVASQLVTSACEELFQFADCETDGFALDANFACKIFTAFVAGCLTGIVAGAGPSNANKQALATLIGNIMGLDLAAIQSICPALTD